MAKTPERAPRPTGERPFRPRGEGYGGPSRGGDRDRGPGAGGRRGGPGGFDAAGGRRHPRRRRRLFGGGKVCQLCVRKIKHVDYKDVELLRFFIAPTGKILPRRLSGACSRHQRAVTSAIKRARIIALLPYRAI
ncbi:30S ribosomal protein S18 [Candidatus Sumerlaeota bacterium]|nr:30S ribosomal protein S18 [Candidatus Sumerlaeota bacterium]